MKLYASATSPYARKARVAALECGHDDLELVLENAFAEDTRVPDVNPLGKVPVLVLDDGAAVFDSPVICEFLDQHGREPTLIPASGRERFEVLTQQALADGVLDAAFAIVMERRRDEGQRSEYWIGRWASAVLRSINAFEETGVEQLGASFDLGAITWACALGYLDFRLPELDWRAGRPRAAEWWTTVRERPSLVLTEPKD